MCFHVVSAVNLLETFEDVAYLPTDAGVSMFVAIDLENRIAFSDLLGCRILGLWFVVNSSIFRSRPIVPAAIDIVHCTTLNAASLSVPNI